MALDFHYCLGALTALFNGLLNRRYSVCFSQRPENHLMFSPKYWQLCYYTENRLLNIRIHDFKSACGQSSHVIISSNKRIVTQHIAYWKDVLSTIQCHPLWDHLSSIAVKQTDVVLSRRLMCLTWFARGPLSCGALTSRRAPIGICIFEREPCYWMCMCMKDMRFMVIVGLRHRHLDQRKWAML